MTMLTIRRELHERGGGDHRHIEPVLLALLSTNERPIRYQRFPRTDAGEASAAEYAGRVLAWWRSRGNDDPTWISDYSDIASRAAILDFASTADYGGIDDYMCVDE